MPGAPAGLRRWTVFVAVCTVERGAAMPQSRIVEVRDVPAPSQLAAIHVGTAWAVDGPLHGVKRLTVNRVWVEG